MEYNRNAVTKIYCYLLFIFIVKNCAYPYHALLKSSIYAILSDIKFCFFLDTLNILKILCPIDICVVILIYYTGKLIDKMFVKVHIIFITKISIKIHKILINVNKIK